MKVAIIITTPPHSYLTVTSIDLIQAMVTSGAEIIGVFLYQDGVIAANQDVDIPNDEFQSSQALINLSKYHNIPLHLCITAAEKRGLTDENENNNIDNQFIVSGLGELVELTAAADKVVQL